MSASARRAVASVLSVEHLGFGFWQAWSMLCYVDGFLSAETMPLPFDPAVSASLTALLFSFCSLALTASIICFAAAKPIDRWVRSAWFPAVGAVLGSVSTVVIYLVASHLLYNAGLFYAACIAAGVGNAMICLSYAPVIGEQPPSRSFLQVCHCMIVCCAIYFIAATAPFAVKCMICALCPLVGGLLPALGNRSNRPDELELQKLSLVPSAWRLFASVFILAAAASLIRSPLLTTAHANTDTEWTGLGTFVVLLVCVAFALFCRTADRPFQAPTLYYPASILVIVFLLVIAVQPADPGVALSSLASAPRTLLNVAFDAIFFCIIYQSKMSPAKIMGLGHGFKSLGILLGGIAGIAIAPSDATRVVFYSAVVLAVVVAIVLIAPERVLNTVLIPIDDKDSEAGQEQDAEEAPGLPDGEPADDHAAAERPPEGKRLWRKRCEAVCARYLLSPRESEVLYLLSLGHGSEFISNELVISLYTARTHTRNIYSKTGVHSREELIKLVRETEVDDE